MKLQTILFWTGLMGMLLTMGLIFYLTTQSVHETLSITRKAVSLAPEAFPNRRELLARMLKLDNPRRMAHIYEFGLLGICSELTFLFYSENQKRRMDLQRWTLGPSMKAIFVCGVYSFSDQIHKRYIPGREFDPYDLCLDAAGYISMILLVCTIYTLFRQKRKETGAIRE